MDAFDSDVLIFAGITDHGLGRRVRILLEQSSAQSHAGVGSVLLLPEVLSKPMRDGEWETLGELAAILSRVELRSTDVDTADLAASLGSSYRLKAADSVHLATAVRSGADRFITNNSKDFKKSIEEIDIVYPSDL